MKKLFIAAIALIGLSFAGFAQNKPAPKKATPPNTQVVKKPVTPNKQADAKKTAMGGHKKGKMHKKHNG